VFVHSNTNANLGRGKPKEERTAKPKIRGKEKGRQTGGRGAQACLCVLSFGRRLFFLSFVFGPVVCLRLVKSPFCGWRNPPVVPFLPLGGGTGGRAGVGAGDSQIRVSRPTTLTAANLELKRTRGIRLFNKTKHCEGPKRIQTQCDFCGIRRPSMYASA